MTPQTQTNLQRIYVSYSMGGRPGSNSKTLTVNIRFYALFVTKVKEKNNPNLAAQISNLNEIHTYERVKIWGWSDVSV